MAETKFVIFKIDSERYGLPINRVERILENQNPTRIPRTPKLVMGVFELRGETLAAVDLRARLDFEPDSAPGNYVVINGSFGRAALRVDGVDGIESFADAEIDESPAMLKSSDDAFFNAIGRKNDRLTVLLDADYLLPEAVAKSVQKVSKVAA